MEEILKVQISTTATGRNQKRSRASKAACSEADIERTCTQLLELDDWRALKTDPVSRREWAKGFGELGMADHLYIRYSKVFPAGRCCDVLWIEWKRKGGKASDHQRAWANNERFRGGRVLIAGEDFTASIEGFLEWYNTRSGLAIKSLTLSTGRMSQPGT